MSRADASIKEAVDAIAGVKSPVVTFAVTVSLRWDYFADVDVSRLGRKKLNNVYSIRHRALRYEGECHKVYRRGSTPTIVYVGNGGCAFAEVGNIDAASFETAETLEYKMMNAISYLAQITKGQHMMGWLVYNVTGGLAPQQCNGSMHRLMKIREIMDTF